MRRRLVVTVVGLVTVVYSGLAIPLGIQTGSAPAAWSLGVGAVAVTGLSWGVAWALHRWIAVPVRALGDVARAVGDGQFDARVPIGAGPTEVLYAARSLNTMIEHVAELVQRQRTFASYASHQIRTPLATLQLCADNLESAVSEPGRADHRMLAHEIGRLSHICDSLLAYARAEGTARPRVVDVSELVDNRCSGWRPAAQAGGVRLVREGADGVCAFTAAEVLDQALDALIENSIKYAGPGSTITVLVQQPFVSHVDIHVTDDGPGMSAADLARAGRAFWQRRQDQHTAGSGLGLTIATALVATAGGRLHLSQARPHGLTARIRLRAVPGSGRQPRAEG
jgi:signal transduction histidine kinase